MTTGSAVIHVVGKSTVSFKGAVVIEQGGTGRSAHMAFEDASMLKSMATRKASKHEARLQNLCDVLSIVPQRAEKTELLFRTQINKMQCRLDSRLTHLQSHEPCAFQSEMDSPRGISHT